jgi:hypothetical protein
MDEQNPYAPPQDDTSRAPEGPAGPEGFVPDGRGVEAGRGYQWITEGWELFKKNPGVWILMTVIHLAIVIGLSFVPYAGQFVGYLLSPFFSAGFALGCHALREDRPFEVGVLFAGFSRSPGRLFALGLIYLGAMVIVAVVAVVVGGGALLAMATGKRTALDPAMMGGILLAGLVAMVTMIPISMAFFYAPALVVLNDLDPLAALRSSFLAAIKNILPFMVYMIVGMLIAFAGMLPCGLGLLVVIPTLTAAVYCSYRDVFYETRAPAW